MNTTLPAILETKLSDFRRRVWVVKLAEGLLAALFGIALSYLLVFILDRFFETPSSIRLCILVAGAVTLGLRVAKTFAGGTTADVALNFYRQRSAWRIGGGGSPGLEEFSARWIEFGIEKRF